MFRPGLLMNGLLLWSVLAHAADPVEDRIRTRMTQLFPEDTVTAISPSPVAGIYEVMLGASLFYITGDGRHVLRGDLIDLDTRQNLSNVRRAEARKQVFAGLDENDVIEFAPDDGKTRAKLFVFTDIDCGYCRKLHQEVPELNAAGIAIDYLAFPRSGLTGESFDKISAVWCSDDRRKALTAAKAGELVTAPSCENPVADQFAMGQAMGVGGTPAVYTRDGQELGGYIPAQRLIKMLAEGKLQ
jgi:thiol:disulfide interchange protein DsbC